MDDCGVASCDQWSKKADPSKKRERKKRKNHKQPRESMILILLLRRLQVVLIGRFHALHQLTVLIREQRVSAGAKVQPITESETEGGTWHNTKALTSAGTAGRPHCRCFGHDRSTLRVPVSGAKERVSSAG